LEEKSLTENQGMLNIIQLRIETALRKRKAFDEKTAADTQEAQINFKTALDLMERGGLIGRTGDGKVFLTQKGQDEQLSGFTLTTNVATTRKIVRFSRNK
jgi:hypothetical protein